MIRLAAFAAMATVWGLTWIAAKWATDGVPPVFVAGARLALACLCFAIWCGIARIRLAVDRPARLVVSALLINTGCYSFLFWGVAHAPTGLAAIVNLALIPIFSMLLGALHSEERITRRRVASIALGAVGLALLFATRGSAGPADAATVTLGLGAIVVATLSYAWGAIVAKPLVRTHPTIAIAFWQTGIGAVSLLVVSAVIERPGAADIARLASGTPLAGLLFLVVGGSLVGFSVYLWLLREWDAFRAGLYAFVSPAIAVGIGVTVLGESFGLMEALGMAVMFGATALVIRPERATVRAT